MEMGTLNLILIVIIAGFAVIGAFRGFAGELAPLVAAIASGVALWFGQPYLRDGVMAIFPTLPPNAVVFYTAIFAVILAIILFFFIAKLVKHLGQWIIPQPFNAILGFLIGGGKAFLLISVIAGAITASQEHIKGIQAKTKESPIANAAATFWSSRFNHQSQPKTPSTTPTNANPTLKQIVDDVKQALHPQSTNE